jgi:hypothetical protein
MLQSYNPENAETFSVWALPISLAATQGIIIIFSSSAYLDVSVQRVILCSNKLEGFPHSEICGSKPLGGSPQLIAA